MLAETKIKLPFSLLTATQFSLFALWVTSTFSTALAETSFVISLIFWLGYKVYSRTTLIPFSKSILIPLACFAAWTCLSYFWSEYSGNSFRGVFKILQQIAIFWMVADSFQTEKDFKRFEGLLVVMLAVVFLDAIYQLVMTRDFIRGHDAFFSDLGWSRVRLTASFKGYGLLATYLICSLPIVIGTTLAMKKNGLSKMWWLRLAIILGSLFIFFFTRSRGAFLAFFITAFCVMKMRYKIISVLSIFALFLLALVTLPREVVKDNIFHTDAMGKEQSIVERYYLWDRAIKVIQAKPITGTGINTYASAHQKYDKTQNWRVRDYYAHNGYLQMAAEIGLPGLLAFLCFLFMGMRENIKFLRQNSLTLHQKWLGMGLFIGSLNFLLLAIVDTVLHSPQVLTFFWFLLGLSRAQQRLLAQ